MFDWDDILIIGDSYVSARDKEFNWPMSLALQLTGLAFNKDRLPRGIGYPGCAWWSVRNELLKQLSIKIPKVLILCHPDKNRYISDENPLGIYIVHGNRKRIGVSPTVYYLYDFFADAINSSADEKYIRLATPEEIEEFKIYTDIKKYNL